MMKKISLALITLLTVLGLGFTSFAYDGAVSSTVDMIYTLFKNEKDPVIRQMGIDCAMVFTGNKEPETRYNDGAVLIGTYQGSYPSETVIKINLLGQYSVRTGHSTNGKTTITTNTKEPLNESIYEKNTEDLKKIYNMVITVKNATARMDDYSKLQYIENYIKSIAPKYVGGCDSVIATTLNNGYCDCDGYAALTYMLGINCGLNIDLACGYLYGNVNASHAWNKVTINGVTYIHDTTGDIPNNTDQFMLVAYGSKVAQDYTEVGGNTAYAYSH